ncbi:hypothetical protein VA7868_00862 [Vibrio aerogenes CECT 7868]|uniref:Inner membrane protein YbhI n=1 Tax=Vibrio aerogenes CECT 7868 TaxID=1216006 RepID=A0A1M5WTZ0_9VIBR|nr:hypothetical protein [Vibrio aerogenes]SHH90872.1 hypothetical protein VA7868_00862 [Vibrio aerogenes CECT 7868]
MSSNVAKISGWLLLGSLVLSVVSALTPLRSFWAGIPVWLAAILLLPCVKPNQKKQIVALLLIGSLCLIFGVIHGMSGQYLLTALEANQKVINMLIAVGFLKLCTGAEQRAPGMLPKGRRALLRTLLGAHLFGAVLNMSSVIIVGDRLAKHEQITPVQGLLLLRAFCICAFWSPFFAAMGLTLVSAPGSQLSTLVLFGIPVSLAGIAVSAWEILRQPSAKELHGYPMAWDSLWMPCFLALVVIFAHEAFASLSVLTLVSVTSVSFTALWLLLNHGSRAGSQTMIRHIESGIAGSAGEVVLFAAAALLAAGVAGVLTSLDLHLAPAHFGYIEAGITLLILVVLAMTGMHPVTSVVLAGSILAPAVSDPNLLGLTLLMGWSLGISLSPFSGVQLSIQSRYEISAGTLLKLNWRYALLMYGFCFTLLWIYTRMT